jgi:hypothetical protein
LRIAKYSLGAFGEDYLVSPPEDNGEEDDDKVLPVVRRGTQIVVRPQGFMLWQTKEGSSG